MIARDPEKFRAWQQRSRANAIAKANAKPNAKPRAKPKPRSELQAKPIARSTPVRKRNPKRLTKRRLAQFGTAEQTAMINAMPCVCHEAPRRHPECNGGPSDPSHVTTRGAGGKACDQVPQSRGCHDAFHRQGRDSYAAAIGWSFDDLLDAAARTWARISEPIP